MVGALSRGVMQLSDEPGGTAFHDATPLNPAAFKASQIGRHCTARLQWISSGGFPPSAVSQACTYGV